jgi:hypothetical protein
MPHEAGRGVLASLALLATPAAAIADRDKPATVPRVLAGPI